MTPALSWWEKITYTFSDSGTPQACQYQSSFAGGGVESCGADEPPTGVASDSPGAFTKITIERRFTPGGQPEPVKLETGDTLLGGQVLALAIDGAGSVQSCEIVAASHEARPSYGCDEIRAERFAASATNAAPQVRRGYMTVLVYGHEEDMA